MGKITAAEKPAKARFGSKLSHAWRRLTATPGEGSEASANDSASQPIRTCGDRDKVCFSGTVTDVRVTAGSEHPRLTAELQDGSGAVTLIWMGRRTIPGVEAGRAMKVHGRVSCQDGARVMYNPRYELVCPR